MENNAPTEKENLERTVECPICGYKSSILVQHIKNKHGLTTTQLREQFPGAKVQSEWFKTRANGKNHLTDLGRRSLSERMKYNNPMKNLEIREKTSKTRKEKYATDPEFRKRMKLLKQKNLDNRIKEDSSGNFKVPGWGISGKFYSFYFRSTNELKFLIWAKKQGKLDSVKSTIRIEYGDEYFYCDFELDGIYYEIKDKTYAQDEREKKQYRLIELMNADGMDAHILNKKSDIIKSITYYDILREWLDGKIKFAKNTSHYVLVRRLTKEGIPNYENL